MIYNVAVQVVDLIDADSPEEAVEVLVGRLIASGEEVVDLSGDAFESDDQDPDYEVTTDSRRPLPAEHRPAREPRAIPGYFRRRLIE